MLYFIAKVNSTKPACRIFDTSDNTMVDKYNDDVVSAILKGNIVLENAEVCAGALRGNGSKLSDYPYTTDRKARCTVIGASKRGDIFTDYTIVTQFGKTSVIKPVDVATMAEAGVFTNATLKHNKNYYYLDFKGSELATQEHIVNKHAEIKSVNDRLLVDLTYSKGKVFFLANAKSDLPACRIIDTETLKYVDRYMSTIVEYVESKKLVLENAIVEKGALKGIDFPLSGYGVIDGNKSKNVYVVLESILDTDGNDEVSYLALDIDGKLCKLKRADLNHILVNTGVANAKAVRMNNKVYLVFRGKKLKSKVELDYIKSNVTSKNVVDGAVDVKSKDVIIMWGEKPISETIALDIVNKSNYLEIEFCAFSKMTNTTEAVNLAACKKDGRCIKFISEDARTEAVQLEAVSNDGRALEYIIKPSEKVVLAALDNSIMSIKFVPTATPAACLKAVTKSWKTLKWIVNQTPELQVLAVKQNFEALVLCQNACLEAQLEGVRQSVEAMRLIGMPYRQTTALAVELYNYVQPVASDFDEDEALVVNSGVNYN